MVENQEGNERLTSTVNGGWAVSLYEKRTFSHIFHLKHVLGGVESDRLRKSRQILCLAGLHRGFLPLPTRAPPVGQFHQGGLTCNAANIFCFALYIRKKPKVQRVPQAQGKVTRPNIAQEEKVKRAKPEKP